MAGPGSYFIGKEELAEVQDEFESGRLSRYGDIEDSTLTIKITGIAIGINVPIC